jgi:Uma2 family endonuclease
MATVETAPVRLPDDLETQPTPDPFADGYVLEIPADAQTYDGFVKWATSDDFPERGRIDYLGGKLFIDMVSEEAHSHGTLKTALVVSVGGFVRQNDLGKVYTDRMRYGSADADTGTEPDVLICTYESIQAGRVRFTETGPRRDRCTIIEGSADLIIEVVSQSSVTKDTRDLRRRYFAAGVREYWIVDARGMWMTFDLLAHRDGDWVEVVEDADGFRKSEVLGRRVRIDRVTDRIGLPDYKVSLEK